MYCVQCTLNILQLTNNILLHEVTAYDVYLKKLSPPLRVLKYTLMYMQVCHI